jgi:hypothetical protein
LIGCSRFKARWHRCKKNEYVASRCTSLVKEITNNDLTRIP